LDLILFFRGLVDEILSATSHRCRIQFQADPFPSPAQGDESLLRHIFGNLLSNAVKYSPAGAEVRLSISCEEGLAVLRVVDRGCGIPATDQERLFQAFHRARNVGQVPGTGLGLAIVKRCVQLHGGKIRCDSKEGEGTTFTVWLPLFGRPLDAGAETSFFYQRSAKAQSGDAER
jgi:signal transduction histidine kinase